MVKCVGDGWSDYRHGRFTNSGWWLVRLYGVHINLSRRIGDIGRSISVEISLLDATVLYRNGASRHNLRKTETDSALELAFDRKRIDGEAAVYGHRNAMNSQPPINDRNFSSARARSVVILAACISDRMPWGHCSPPAGNPQPPGRLDSHLHFKYLDIKLNEERDKRARVLMAKLESLSGGSGVHVFLVLWKAARAVQAHAEKSITDLAMCGSDFAVLEALLHKGPLPVNEIGRKILLTSGSITVAVDRLEQKGLVERRAHGSDRRARVVHLTREGRKLITRAYAQHAEDLERLVSASLTAKERATLIRLLKKIGYQAADYAHSQENAV